MNLASELIRETSPNVPLRAAFLMRRAAIMLNRIEAACDVLERQSDEALAAAGIELRAILREENP